MFLQIGNNGKHNPNNIEVIVIIYYDCTCLFYGSHCVCIFADNTSRTEYNISVFLFLIPYIPIFSDRTHRLIMFFHKMLHILFWHIVNNHNLFISRPIPIALFHLTDKGIDILVKSDNDNVTGFNNLRMPLFQCIKFFADCIIDYTDNGSGKSHSQKCNNQHDDNVAEINRFIAGDGSLIQYMH